MLSIEALGKAKISKANGLQLTVWANRIFALAESNPKSISTAVAKDLIYIEEEFEKRLFKNVPILKELERLKEREILEEPKKKKEGIQKIKFFITATNNLGCVVAKFPIEANGKEEALKEAKEQAKGLPDSKKLKFKVA